MKAVGSTVACALAVGGAAATAVLQIPQEPLNRAELPPNIFQKRYFSYACNFNRWEDVEILAKIMARAAEAGYNGVVLGSAGGQFSRLPKQSKRYFANFKFLQAKASQLGLVLIPRAMNAATPTHSNKNLVGAFPIRESRFVVKKGKAVVLPDSLIEILNPGFEQANKNTPKDWRVDRKLSGLSIDRTVKHSENASVCLDWKADVSSRRAQRIGQTVFVNPFRSYQLSFWAQTKNYSTRHSGVGVYGKNQQPLYISLKQLFAAEQGWKKYSICFNSLNNTKATIWLGDFSSRGRQGKIWFDDVDLREIGLYNVVRRESLPVHVVSQEDKRVFTEGTDYVVGDGELQIPETSAIREGSVLYVSWYQMADVSGATPAASACHEEFFSTNKRLAQELNSLFTTPPGFLMNYRSGHGGWQVANWDPACGTRNSGEYLANIIARSEKSLKEINPQYEIYLWNDVVDPYANSVNRFWLFKGPRDGALSGLSKGGIIMNNNHYRSEKSLRFFATSGYLQMIVSDPKPKNLTAWLTTLGKVERNGIRGVVGILYFPPKNGNPDRYDNLEKFAQRIKASGRWGTGPAFRITEPLTRTDYIPPRGNTSPDNTDKKTLDVLFPKGTFVLH